jgi:putative oxidoreductase
MRIGLKLLRLAVGGFFVGHGTQKLFGWFGGGGLDATAEGFEHLGLRPARENAIAAGVAEAGGGALLATGVATPLAASVLTATMLTAIDRVHLKNGPWAANGGYEYNVVMIASALTVAEAGRGRSGRTALGALIAGVAGALGVRLLAKVTAEPQPGPDTDQSDGVVQEQEAAPSA